ncbi:MAG: toprim domain-containing protein, partial [Gemmatimonadetes bacterium]|nr:toprim domain-containing protein [Gemmatimonadota bacterium]
GVDLRERETKGRGEDPYRVLYEVNAFARDYYTRQLWDDAAGESVRRYLEERGIARAVAERFGLGYAPAEWNALREAAAAHKIGDALLLDVGLLKESDRGRDPYDRFRDRLIFPIEDASGRVVAFGGRVIGAAEEGTPKYLNSPETVIYHKGSVLYGLSWAKIALRREGAALLVEGYMDLVSLVASGIENVVATLGTAMTAEQARLVARYCRRMYILYDSDQAGRRATFRAADLLLAEGVHPEVASLPAGDDPDSLVRREGPDAVRRYIKDAIDVLDSKLHELAKRGLLDSTAAKWDALKDRLLPTIRATKDLALRDIYVRRLEERVGVGRQAIENDLTRMGPLPPPTPAALRRPRERPIVLPELGPERRLILLLIKSRDFIERTAEQLGADELGNPVLREIFAALVAHPELRAPPESMSPEGVHRWGELMDDPEILADEERILQDSIKKIKVRRLDEQMADLEKSLANAAEEEQSGLVRSMQELVRQRRELDEDHWVPTARKHTHVSQPVTQR